MQAHAVTYDLAVCWRIYPGVSKTPVFFPDDKFSLARLSFQSFVKSVTGLRVKYFIVLDGCPPVFTAIFTTLIPAQDLEFIHTERIGNQSTFRKQIEILSTQTDAELVYFAEDDYLYRPDAFVSLVRFMQQYSDADFVTPYDHQDYYTHPIHKVPGQRRNENGSDWKSVVSTCLTFLTRKSTLIQTREILETYCRGNTDGSMWVLLTRTFRFRDVLKYYFTDKTCFFMLKKAMKYNFGTFRKGKRYSLWCPVPAVGTHLESGFLAPGIDWEKIKEGTIST